MVSRRYRSLDTPSIHSLFSLKNNGEFIDDDGDSDIDDPLDDSDKDRDYIFGKGYSESEASSDDEHEGPSATTMPPLHTVAAVASSPSSTPCLQPSQA